MLFEGFKFSYRFASKMPTKGYFGGKEGWLPNITDWKIPGKKSKAYPEGKASLKELFSAKGYQKGGEFLRKGITTRATGFATGAFGIGAVEYAQGKEGWFPDWGRPGQFPKVVDTTGSGKGLVNVTLPEIVIPEIVIPELPKIPAFPTMPTFDFSGIGEGLAQGLAGLGAGIGGGMPSMPSMPSIPSMPSMSLTGEEGEPNLLVIGGLAFIAYKVLGGGK